MSVEVVGSVTASRRLVLGAGAILMAVALGLVSADGWRWHLSWFNDVASSQSGWALGAWLTARWLSGGRWRVGVLLGTAFGALALAAYYVFEWRAYSLHSATSQLSDSGIFWVPAAVLGGAVVGVLGAAAAQPARPVWLDPSTLGHVVLAGAVLAEAAYVLRSGIRLVGATAPVAAVLAAVALVLLVVAGRRGGRRALAGAALVALLLVPVAAVAFLALERTVGYITL